MDLFGLNNKIFSNNNNIMLEIIDELNQMKDNSQDNLIISKLGDIINKMNSIIDENKKIWNLFEKIYHLIYHH